MFIVPDWPAPSAVVAAVTTRQGGVSEGPYRSLNTATHVGDNPSHVQENRQRLIQQLQLPAAPRWLNQVHGTVVVAADQVTSAVDADAAYSTAPGVVCAVQTADCLPVLFCSNDGRQVAAAHAGWAGLLAGVLEDTVARFAPSDQLMAWLGPAISQTHFEVGPELREAFIEKSASTCREQTASAFIASSRSGHWMADLYQLARLRLEPLGVKVFGGGLCTYSDEARFFSYRRDRIAGRMASLIYIKS